MCVRCPLTVIWRVKSKKGQIYVCSVYILQGHKFAPPDGTCIPDGLLLDGGTDRKAISGFSGGQSMTSEKFAKKTKTSLDGFRCDFFLSDSSHFQRGIASRILPFSLSNAVLGALNFFR